MKKEERNQRGGLRPEQGSPQWGKGLFVCPMCNGKPLAGFKQGDEGV